MSYCAEDYVPMRLWMQKHLYLQWNQTIMVANDI